MTEIENRIENLEEAIAHLVKSNEELSGELALQWKRVERLEKALKHYEVRFQELESKRTATPADEKPPHW